MSKIPSRAPSREVSPVPKDLRPLPNFQQAVKRKAFNAAMRTTARILIPIGKFGGAMGLGYSIAKRGVGGTFDLVIGKPVRYLGRVAKNIGSAIYNTNYQEEPVKTNPPKSEQTKNF